MRIKYDKESDIMCVKFSDNEIEETIEEKQGIIIDYDKNGNIVSIEILNASEKTESPNKVVYEIN